MIKSTGLLGVPTPDLMPTALSFVTKMGAPAIHRIFPVVDVSRFKDNFPRDSVKDRLAVADTRRARGAGIAERESQRDYDGYEVVNDAIYEKVPIEDIGEYPNADQDAAVNAALVVIRSLERNGAAQLAAATVTAGTNLFAPSTPWTTVASCTPLVDFNTVAGYVYNRYGITKDNLSFAIPRKHLDAFPTMADFRATLGVNVPIGGAMNLEAIRQYFGCKEIVPLAMQYDSANFGQTASAAACWDTNNAYVYWNSDNYSDGGVPKMAGMGRMFTWNAPQIIDPGAYAEMLAIAQDMGVPPITLFKDYDSSVKSWKIGAGTYNQTKIINSGALARLGSLG